MKGWTVIAQPIKNNCCGIEVRQQYLFNAHHENHQSTESITLIFGKNDNFKNIIDSAKTRAKQLRDAKKGGRPPSSYAMEFVLTLPKGYRPTNLQWNKILTDCLKEIANAVKVPFNLLKEVSAGVLHRQSQEECVINGSGDHCHLVVGKFLQNGHFMQLQKKTMTHTVKDGFNESSLNVCGYDWKRYAENLRTQKHPNKKRVSDRTLKTARKYQHTT